MKKSAVSVLLGPVLLSQAFGTILLNEIHINPPPDPDLNFEFIELRSDTNAVEACTGLTLLIIENNGGSIGEVEEALDLSLLSTGPNGLLLLGNGYTSLPLGGPWSGFRDPATPTGDPAGVPPHSGLGDDDLDPSGGLTFLLVSGWTGMTNANASSLGDVDVDNDNLLDWTEPVKPAGGQVDPPFSAIIDSIGYRDLGNNPVRRPYTTSDLNIRPGSAPTYAPDNISRRRSRATAPTDQNNVSAWYGANLVAPAAASITYDPVQYFGDFRGQATPGQANLDAPPVPGVFLLNEVVVDASDPSPRPPGLDPAADWDGNFEYIEIVNTALNNGSLAASLQGYSLVLVGTSVSNQNVGRILEAWNLDAFSTGPNGLLLLGDDYPSGRAPWGKLLDPLTQLGDPSAPDIQIPVRYSSLGEDDIRSNNGFTLLLVRGYAGTIDQIIGNAAGQLTAQPWLALADSVGFDEVDPNTGNPSGGKTFAVAKIDPTYVDQGATKHYNPDMVARKLGNSTAQSAAAWYGGQLGSRSPYGIALQNGRFLGGFRGESTPGSANLAATPPSGTVLLNEVHLNPPTAPDLTEFIELINPDRKIVGMADMWLLVVSASGTELGTVKQVLDLRGISTGPNGLAFLGDGVEEDTNLWVLQSFIPHATHREDPRAFRDDGTEDTNLNFGTDFLAPDDGLAVLLVRGFTGTSGQDLDADNNGAFDVSPWAQLADSISFGAVVDPAVPSLPFAGFTPGNLARVYDNVAANSAGAWYGGELEGTSTSYTTTTYTTHWTGTFQGAASPGRHNHTATPNANVSLLLNELHMNPPGGDGNNEFIELLSGNRQSMSTNSYTILLFDVTGNDIGRVQEVWSLDGLATGANGMLLTGSGYLTLENLPWTGTDAIAAGTRIGSPTDMEMDDIGRGSDNGALTAFLVKDFRGRVGDDFDTLDDGSFDVQALAGLTIVDSVGLREYDPSLIPPYDGVVYGGVDLTQVGYTPDNISRFYDNLAPRLATAWYGGDVQPTSGTTLAYDTTQRFPADAFIGAVTPGHPNLTPNEVVDDLADEDLDTAVNIIEAMLGMSPAVSDAHKLPSVTTVSVAGLAYPALSFTRLTGGTVTPPNKYSISGMTYAVEFSLDCVAWSDATQLSRAEEIGGNPSLDLVVYRPSTEAFTQGQAVGRMFLRLRVYR